MRKTGFTLVEILIVVIILGILAAIVIPQFTSASTNAKQSSLVSDLQVIRSQLELYKTQHMDNYPAAASMVTLLTSRTDANGTVGTDPNLAPYGPYLQSFPVNPVNTKNTVGNGSSAPAADNAYGWWWNTSTNKFSPDDNGAGDANL